ncbi:M48 family metalloprotease [Sandaracinobacter sp. RS1-74]|uniref:M48 family metalloprotease n=1 Tax=Sandaracinobacteroides sayramensis TaxID=2913411 RepID=UPI001EDBE6BC|nr:M48 family metalloprotease [Sandaracinobacteroides sayramensis]MCG2839835.1 M48 family metalloprotease [Sandaracinobacteroides sayramensis]
MTGIARSTGEGRRKGSAAKLLALCLGVGLAAPALPQQSGFPFPFPLPLPQAGGAGLPRMPFNLPFIAPPLPAVPADSAGRRQVIAQEGAPMTGPAADLVARSMEAVSTATRPVSPPGGFRVTLIDSPAVNAMALGDGNIFVTRQILALMNSPEELIGILGHEVGHVMARHSLFDATTGTGQRGSLGLLGAIAPDVAKALGLSSTLALRVFDRAQEHQSDVTGTKVLADMGLDPMGMHSGIALLERDAVLQQRISGPVRETMMDYWLRTHPVSGERLQLIQTAAAMAPVAGPPRKLDRQAFLRTLDGLPFDDGPAQGVAEGGVFRQPGQRLALTIPQGSKLLGGGNRLALLAPGGGKAMVVTVSEKLPTQSLFAAAWKSELGKYGAAPTPAPVALPGGTPALYGAREFKVEGKPVTIGLQVAPWRDGRHIVMLLIAPPGGSQPALDSFRTSLRPMTAADDAAFRYRVIRVVTAGPNDNVATLARRMAYADHAEDRFRALNGLGANDRLASGQMVKLAVWNR